MSHFAVLVVGDNVEEQLAPFHEFECTGRNDQYVANVDDTEQIRSKYETGKFERMRGADGKYYAPWENQFYRDPTFEEERKIGKSFGFSNHDGLRTRSQDWEDGRGYRAKVEYVPEGFERVEVPYSTVYTFTEFVTQYDECPVVPFGEAPDFEGAHKYRYALQDAFGNVTRVFDRTNPNAKWDWYRVGGRWTGFFKLKPGAVGNVGSPGLMTPVAEVGTADSARKGDIDFDGMRDEFAKARLEKFDKFHRIVNGRTFISWTDMLAKYGDDIKTARAEYQAQPVIRDINNAPDHEFVFASLERYMVDRDEFELIAWSEAVVLFAILMDGRWYEKGQMGWWGTVSSEKDRDEWNKQFTDLLNSLPDVTLLTVVDCHI